MNENDQPIAIAEACGKCVFQGPWVCIEPYVEYNQEARYKCPKCNAERDSAGYHSISSYLHDLNAMHEAERTLTFLQAIKYRRILSCNSGKRNSEYPSTEAAICHATASERAEAFLRTKGLWK